MPYLTPETIPESTTCRALLIPESSEWLAIFSGALTELTLRYNWEQQGITVDEALEVVSNVVNGFYDGCVASGCALPDGSPVLRVNPETGLIEQLVNGEWVPPQGDYYIPPTSARTDPTSEERRCLASANAVNALHLMYESLSDSYGEALELSAAITALGEVLITTAGAIFGLVVPPLLVIYGIMMGTVYATIAYITADLWDEEFTDKLECMFYDCSSDDGGVVHFDYQCIIDRIGGATDIDFDTFLQIRLLLQIGYLLNMIGSQALDAAGTATAIVEADCDVCAPPINIVIWNWDGEPPPAFGVAPDQVVWGEEFDASGAYRNTVSGQDIYFLNMAFSRAVDIELLDQGTWAPLTFNSSASIYGWTYSEDNMDVGDYDFVRWGDFSPQTDLPVDYFGYHGFHVSGNGAFTLRLRFVNPL